MQFKPQNSCAHAKRECKDEEAEKRQIRGIYMDFVFLTACSATTPLTQRELIFCPSNMEKRGRWWINEKRRCDMSPERLPLLISNKFFLIKKDGNNNG